MNRLLFAQTAWEDYLYWQTQDAKTLKRLNALLKDILRDPFGGIGKPEPLKNNSVSLWSRRIDGYNRVVYRVQDDIVEIIQCRYHYDE